MKDKAFERLLRDSIQTYGHEYLTGTDDRREITPLPHTFPEHFLDDIVLPSQRQTKPFVRVIRILSACAAVLAVLTAITVIPLVLNQRNKVETSENSAAEPLPFWPQSTASADIASRGELTPAGEAPEPSLYPEYTNRSSAVRQDGEVPDMSDGYLPQDTQSAAHPSEGKAIDSAGEVSDDTIALPQKVSAQLMIGQEVVPVASAEVEGLVMMLADGFRADYQQTAAPDLTGETVQMRLNVSAEEPMLVYGKAYRQLQAVMTEQAWYLRAVSDSRTAYYLVGKDDPYYGFLHDVLASAVR